MQRPNPTNAIGALLLILALSPVAAALPGVGDSAIDFVVRDTEDQEVRLFDHEGRVVYAVFWIPG